MKISAAERAELRRDPQPSKELLASFDPLNLILSIDELLGATEDSRHRRMLLNLRRHALLEILGRWDEFLNPEMMVEEPFYRIGSLPPIEGYQAISEFYGSLIGDGCVGGMLVHDSAVADWGTASESLMYMQVSGVDLAEQGEDVKPDAWYAVTNWSHAFMAFDGQCRLVGEMIYDDLSSRRVTELDPELVMTPEHLRETMRPLLETDVA